MRQRRVDWAQSARDDLTNQAAYIAEYDPDAAYRIISKIESVGEQLGKAATGHPGRVPGIYEKLVAGLPYIIAYAVEPIGVDERIVIVRVIHTARDWRQGSWPHR